VRRKFRACALANRKFREEVHLSNFIVRPCLHLSSRRRPDNLPLGYTCLLLLSSLSLSLSPSFSFRRGGERGGWGIADPIARGGIIGRVQIDSLCSRLSAFLSAARIWAPASDYDEWLATTRKREREKESGESVQNKRAPPARQQVGVAAALCRRPCRLSTIMDSS